jgi:tRNA-specific 2-thiouridylase
LGIPFYVVDFSQIFKKKVVDYFLEEYGAGLTPNPCVMCNRYIKFGKLLDYIIKLGFDYLATGHYSRIVSKLKAENSKLKTYHLLQAKDKSKDQSYFLYNLTQAQLAHILFPVGEYTKTQVRKMAKKWGLAVAERPESQEICFFPESDYRPFLCRQIPQKIIPGEVVDAKGRVIGRHFGLPLYTIGQRHGFEIVSRTPRRWPNGLLRGEEKAIPPFYVVGKDSEKNRLIVGFGKEAEQKDFWVKDVNWIDPNLKFKIENLKFFVRIRHQGELLNCQIDKLSNYQIKVTLKEPQRGIAPGQAAVFYRKFQASGFRPQADFEVLGGGIIQ